MTGALVRFELAAQRQSIPSRHHDITKHQIRNGFQRLLISFLPVGGFQNSVFFPKVGTQVASHVFIILHHQHQRQSRFLHPGRSFRHLRCRQNIRELGGRNLTGSTGKGDGKGGPPGLLTLHADTPSMQHDQFAGKSQAQAGSSLTALRLARLIEGIEYLVNGFRRDARTAVAHPDPDGIRISICTPRFPRQRISSNRCPAHNFVRSRFYKRSRRRPGTFRWQLQLHRDRPSGRSEFKGIGDQINEDFVEFVGVKTHDKTVLRGQELQMNAFLFGKEIEGTDHMTDKSNHITLFRVECHLPGFDLSEIEQLIDQSQQTLCVAVHQLQILPGLWPGSISSEQLAQGVNNEAQRGTKLMRNIGKEPRFDPVKFSDFLCFEFLHQNLMLVLFPGNDKPVHPKGYPQNKKSIGHISPGSGPPGGVHHNGQHSRFRTPDPVTVGRKHFKGIGTRRQVRINCCPTGSIGMNPILIVALQHIGIHILLRAGIMQPGKLNGESSVLIG